jgi:hypothetical protein
MVARTQPDARFNVTFLRDGEMIDSRPAGTGDQALKAALLLLCQLDALQDGDRLTVTERAPICRRTLSAASTAVEVVT